MNDKVLSKRLQLVANFLPNQANFVDVGSDHAYLPCYVCSKDKDAIAIAGEINEGPYLSAKKHVADCHLSDRIQVIKGDGLEVISNHNVDQIVIAGMGGTLIRSILTKGQDQLADIQRIIVQPNVDATDVREWFYQNNYGLVAEEIIKEDGHIYEILVADRGNATSVYDGKCQESLLLFGPYLIREKNAVFIEKWESEKRKLERIIKQMNQAKEVNHQKIEMFQTRIQMIEEVLTHD
ncbi:tRNA (adenine(22)-N(1))-methyltransferase [Paraliobacillus sp. PM-2]|uniref:tRNA (adenine(22)-N(1))-methyltransferase n=1 Tax=Paraliobacillus sp. PM-2 TaxID=1462524 RepID=UPI00061C3481|nr:tRNA (adenine(22)-N(1))-methyltransferase TrmK [Paraliobacillus sp. PM-2]CQR46869.1 tRNA (adenine(22)-N(1))-methyltransferase [Paraliobacillus sp. PM-2]